ncbi:MAG: hypothetical protein GC159_17245 [Phycisphaera sp.]|nr:hypothetical protein [Phycisphaera sp.]
MDRFTDVSYTGWGGRLGNSLMGGLIGLLLLVVSFPVLFWNEGRAVQTAKSLEEGQGAVVAVKADTVDPANEKKLVHLTGTATTDSTVKDSVFGVAATALRLKREVEMYQWTEEQHERREKTVGGGERKYTEYIYDTQWVDHHVNSSNFDSKHRAGHENPASMPYESAGFNAEKVTLGAFTLADSQVGMIDKYEHLPAKVDTLPDDLKGKLKEDGGGFYMGESPSSPAVGDVRIRFEVVKPTAVSVIAQQVGESFQPYQTKAGDSLNMLEMGTMDAAMMFKVAQDRNKMLTWILRGAGAFMMFLGLVMMMGPLHTFFDVIPFVGNIVGGVTAIAAGILAVSMSSITIGVAWVFYRPLLGVPLLAGGIALIVLTGMKKRKAA